MNREEKINLSALIVLVGFCISVFYHYTIKIYFGLTYPFNTFLFRPAARFSDFTDLYNLALDPNGIWGFPMSKVTLYPFTLLPVKLGLIVFLLSFLSFFIYCCISKIVTKSKIESWRNIFIFTCLSYPCLFAIDRANNEMIIFVLLYLFVFFYNKIPMISTVLLSIAISMKVFPAVFSVLLFSERKWKSLIILIIISLFLIITCLWLQGTGVNGFIKGASKLSNYNKIYVYGNEGLFFGNSIYGALKYFYIQFISASNLLDFNNFVAKPYLWGVLILFSGVAYYIIKIETVFWKKVALLVFCFNMFPYVSADYKLLQVFIPFFCFVNYNFQERFDYIYTILFSSLFIPKAYYHLPAYPEASISIVLNPLIMLLFSMLIIISGIKSRKKCGRHPSEG